MKHICGLGKERNEVSAMQPGPCWQSHAATNHVEHVDFFFVFRRAFFRLWSGNSRQFPSLFRSVFFGSAVVGAAPTADTNLFCL